MLISLTSTYSYIPNNSTTILNISKCICLKHHCSNVAVMFWFRKALAAIHFFGRCWVWLCSVFPLSNLMLSCYCTHLPTKYLFKVFCFCFYAFWYIIFRFSCYQTSDCIIVLSKTIKEMFIWFCGKKPWQVLLETIVVKRMLVFLIWYWFHDWAVTS